MSLLPHQLELLAPARTTEIAREAIVHGADAVYIGGPAFGARHNAGNPLTEIEALVTFAHRYHARVMVTVNTILHDDELEPAQRLIRDVHATGADALIIQDLGILELDIPPIELHASTQCDIRTPEKAAFLAACGFSQIVLARELSLPEITAIRASVPQDVALEYFIHGALCVAFSGQCYISHAQTGRSANRGDCSQACRLPYTLKDTEGRVVAYEKHLLSLKDNDQSANLDALVDAGIRSFKIEGRLKDMGYVKNITAHYRRLLDDLLTRRPDLARASSGAVELKFTPDPDRSFHREHTDYFVHGRQSDIGAFDSPKYIGPAIGEVTRRLPDGFEMASREALANGDGLSFMHGRESAGLQADVVEKLDATHWRVRVNDPALLKPLKPGMALHRNHDHTWETMLTRPSATRRIGIRMNFSEQPDGFALGLCDDDGTKVSVAIATEKQPARQPERFESGLREQLGKLGGTLFHARSIEVDCAQAWFLPAGQINALRRNAVAALEAARLETHRTEPRRPSDPEARYPGEELSYLANVYNHAARTFYMKHGVKLIDAAYEAHEEDGEVSLMITKHCLRDAFNLCPKQAKGVQGVQGQVRAEPMTLVSGNETFILKFACKPCEMHVMGRMKRHILRDLPPGANPVGFFRKRP